MDPPGHNLTLPNVPDYEDHINQSSKKDYKMNHTSLYDELYITDKVLITLYNTICILGILENGLVIWIAGFRMKKTINAEWLLHLAIADFLCCVLIPLLVAYEVDLLKLSFIHTILLFSLLHLTTTTSVLLLTAMSVDRWVSVMWPFWAKLHRTRKRVRITAGILWSISSVFNFLLIFLNSIYDLDYYLIFQLIHLVVMFVIPFLIIFTSYVTIVLKLRKSKRPPRSQRPYRIITAVILCFFICWAPFYLWAIVRVYFYMIIVHIIIVTLAYLNSCINPIIYVFMDPEFQEAFLRSIPFRVQKDLSDDPDDPCRDQEDGEPPSN